jgi:hypothetical protein
MPMALHVHVAVHGAVCGYVWATCAAMRATLCELMRWRHGHKKSKSNGLAGRDEPRRIAHDGADR